MSVCVFLYAPVHPHTVNATFHSNGSCPHKPCRYVSDQTRSAHRAFCVVQRCLESSFILLYPPKKSSRSSFFFKKKKTPQQRLCRKLQWRRSWTVQVIGFILELREVHRHTSEVICLRQVIEESTKKTGIFYTSFLALAFRFLDCVRLVSRAVIFCPVYQT